MSYRMATVADLTRYDLGKRVIVPMGAMTGIYMYPSAFGGADFVGGILNAYGNNPNVGSVVPQAHLTIDGRGFGCSWTCQIEIEEQ